MSRLVVASALVAGIGSTLLLSEVPWFRRPAVFGRLSPYLPGRSGALIRGDHSIAEAISPIVIGAGARISSLLGLRTPLERRLEHAGLSTEPAEFRLHQAAISATAATVALLLALVAPGPATIELVAIVAAPCLSFLLVEQRLELAVRRRQERRLRELPIVTEQLGMLLASGHSTGTALNRILERGTGVVAEDLRHVRVRVQQGVAEADALREWADAADLPAVDRLVSVLRLDREAGDVSRLVSQEARSMRDDLHRSLIETVERRTQLVWIPVTVAALVPGVILVAIPFIDAMSQFATS